MKQHLNTLFVTTQGAYVAKEGQAVVVRVDGEARFRLPMHNLAGIMCFGQVSCSPWLMEACAKNEITLSFVSESGRFLAAVHGFSPGNVLLRREQYRRADDMQASVGIARNVVAAKIANSRSVLLRGARDYKESPRRAELMAASARLAACVPQARAADSLDMLRGIEGESAALYFGAFNGLLTAQQDAFAMTHRTRRPPMDRINSLLSFLYAMLAHDARGACESVGLDAAVGFLHRDRPGRPGLALDLMEEFRALLADRVALNLVNRQQVKPDGFREGETGGIEMDDATRKTVIAAYQERKQKELIHPFLNETVSAGLLVHLQARLLARHLRGDLDAYPAFIAK
ncbi:MAG: type I-C CRISPR-associated endonuclease Cas1c [Gemmatimonadaceae bacterium]